MVKIQSIEALEILDSRGDPTVEVSVILSDKTVAKASVASGASTGAAEAFELRDNDRSRYGGKGVLKAVGNVNTIIQSALIGHDVADQVGVDKIMIELDGTENKRSLGANAMLGVSLAVARAASMMYGLPLYEYLRSISSLQYTEYQLPVPTINVFNGGKHASTNLDLQEFWIVPKKATLFRERLRQGSEIFHALGMILKEAGRDTDLGNEGGYAPDLKNHQQAFDYILKAITSSSLTAGDDVWLGMDAGSSVLFDSNKKLYNLSLENTSYTSTEFIDFFMKLVHDYPIIALEDPLGEDEWSAWSELSQKLNKYNADIRLVGDDLFVTNIERLQRGIKGGIANSIIIKPNQIGTLSETLECIKMAKDNSYSTIISHRSGETTDTFIADLAVAVNSEYIKTGSTARGERMAKYNRLLEIEKELYG